MNILIIEDERPAADRLMKILKEAEPTAVFPAVLDTVRSSVDWLSRNPSPDIIIMDIHLADGQSFNIFQQVHITSPVIFTTAYDEHALEAFKVNSIDYLLKPVKKEDLQRALAKWKNLSAHASGRIGAVLQQLSATPREYRKRIVIRIGEVIRLIDVGDIAYFYTENRVNYLCTFSDLRYPVDHQLDELDTMLDPAAFFRINRQFIINIKAIEKMQAWSKSRIKSTLNPPCREETIVSTERSPLFREWLTGSSA